MQPTRNSTFQEQRAQPSVGGLAAHSAIPLFFGTSGRPLSGWYHPAVQRARPRLGVVICAPYGYEMMRTYRACRHLAERLAASGVPVLRFDYDGTGDSAGSDHDAGRVNAWTSSIGLAVDELRARSSVVDVALFGIRLGALLATEYARLHHVAALMLLAPIVSGRAFVRELRAVEAMNTGQALDASDGVDVLGYHLSGDTRADLGRLDLLKAESLPAVHTLVIGREDLPGPEPQFVLALERAGAVVTSSVTSAYAGMVADPHKAIVPFELWDEVVQWVRQVPLREQPGVAFTVPTTGAPAQLAIFETPDGPVRETFVSDGGVFGVLCRPADDQPSASGTVTPFRAALPTILLLNIGMNHHVGSHRLWVTTSRAWAAQGYQVVRLDVSGIGDSTTDDMEAERTLYSEQAPDDVRRLMSVLETAHGARRFLLCGLCAGAYMAYHTAVADPRVAGVVLINPRTFEWHEGDSLEEQQRTTFKSTDFYRRAAMNPDTWLRLARGHVHARVLATEMIRRIGARASGTWGRLVDAIQGTTHGNALLTNMQMLCRRGTTVLLVFGPDEVGIDVVDEHLGGGASRMRAESNFQMQIIDGADHTFTGRAARNELLVMLDAHLRRLRE